jgi:hypothetical protein
MVDMMMVQVILVTISRPYDGWMDKNRNEQADFGKGFTASIQSLTWSASPYTTC